MSSQFQIVALSDSKIKAIIDLAVQRAIEKLLSREDIANRRKMTAMEVARHFRIRSQDVITALSNGNLRGRKFRGSWQISLDEAELWHGQLIK